ncbi:MAG: pyridoxal phosphate-dependent aminotransferase [Planctomycetota bacterium]|nr:pyridoxal phosphate-dependent aminotransferase [Planctomycetota bacterium]
MNLDDPRISNSARQVQPFLAMEIFERSQELERQGIDIVHLEVGEPDFSVPACVDRAISQAVEGGHTHYTHSLGRYDLREEVAAYYKRRYGVTIDAGRVLVTGGTSGALVLLMALLLEPGDEILLPNPGYACYDNFVLTFHGKPTGYEVPASTGFRYNPAFISKLINERSKGILINSPSNPTAAVQDHDTLEQIAALGVPVISDEIYHGLEYGGDEGRAVSMLEVTDDCFVVDGFSKRHAMTGLRVGWLVAPEDLVAPLQRLQQNLFVCASSLAQTAAIAALQEGEEALKAMTEQYAQRREVLYNGLLELGFPIPCKPMGAYYIFAKADHLDSNSLRLARRILEEAHVGVAPGIDFGSRAEGWLRFSFANNIENLNEALQRLKKWLSAFKA